MNKSNQYLIENAIHSYMARFYGEVNATTKGIENFKEHGLNKSMLIAPSSDSRDYEKILKLWQGTASNVVDGGNKGYLMPFMTIAVDRDPITSSSDFARTSREWKYYVFPEDEKERFFKIKVAMEEVNARIVIFAQDRVTANELFSQLTLFHEDYANRRFKYSVDFSNIISKWGIQSEGMELVGTSEVVSSKNITCIPIDITFKVSKPYMLHPAKGADDADNKGDTEDESDFDGYEVVKNVKTTYFEKPFKGEQSKRDVVIEVD